MHLDEGTDELTLLRKDILHYCQGLLTSLKKLFPGNKDFKDLQLGGFFY